MKSKKWLTIILFSAGVFLLLFLPLIISNLKKINLYGRAEEAFLNKDYDSAWKIFAQLKDFRDSSQRLEALEKIDFLLPLRNASKGDYVKFGRFEQDAYEQTGLESLEWLILDKIDNHLLLLSSEILSTRAYNYESFKEITWEKSDIRSYLNGDFYETSFNKLEKSVIEDFINKNENQSEVDTPGGKDTLDKVFLLSESEYAIYINDDLSVEDIGKACGSPYAVLQGLKVDENSFSPWWLRSPGVYPYSAQFVDSEGHLYLSGAYVDIAKSYGVRPAIWIKIGPGEEESDVYIE